MIDCDDTAIDRVYRGIACTELSPKAQEMMLQKMSTSIRLQYRYFDLQRHLPAPHDIGGQGLDDAVVVDVVIARGSKSRIGRDLWRDRRDRRSVVLDI